MDSFEWTPAYNNIGQSTPLWFRYEISHFCELLSWRETWTLWEAVYDELLIIRSFLVN